LVKLGQPSFWFDLEAFSPTFLFNQAKRKMCTATFLNFACPIRLDAKMID
jgi:hypothetical protein